jgi:hypothetical protein
LNLFPADPIVRACLRDLQDLNGQQIVREPGLKGPFTWPESAWRRTAQFATNSALFANGGKRRILLTIRRAFGVFAPMDRKPGGCRDFGAAEFSIAGAGAGCRSARCEDAGWRLEGPRGPLPEARRSRVSEGQRRLNAMRTLSRLQNGDAPTLRALLFS